jgi:hypothetical protein
MKKFEHIVFVDRVICSNHKSRNHFESNFSYSKNLLPRYSRFFSQLRLHFQIHQNFDHVISDWTNKSKVAGYCIFPLANAQKELMIDYVP